MVDHVSYQLGWEQAYAQYDTEHLWVDDPIPFMGDAINALKTHGARTVLDIGCGEGRNLRALTDAGFVSAGADIAPSGLKRARNLVEQAGFLVQADAAGLPFFSDSVDAVTCFDVIGHVDNPAAVIAEAERIMASGGVLLLNAFSHEDSEYGEGERLGEDAFHHRGTIYRFYTKPALRDLLDGWDIHRIDKVSWQDPPHGEFRPYTHTHDSWLLQATPEKASDPIVFILWARE